MTTPGMSGERAADEVLESMIVDSIGADSPMTPAALAIASVEVGGRLDAARELVHGAPKEIRGDLDSKAIYALLMLEIEGGAFKRPV